MESSTSISFTTTHSTATVTIVQSTWKAENAEKTKTIKLDNTEIGIPASESGTGYYKYVINNVAAGNHTITRGGGESGVFYVKVVESNATVIPDSDFGFTYTDKKAYMGETYEGNLFVNLLNVSPITFSSSNTDVATVDNSTGAVTLKGAGTTTITAHFAGNNEYAAKDATYELTVGAALSETNIPISALRYQPGVNGINGSQMARAVGGFNLTFSSNDGIKCNNTNNFFFRTNSSGVKGTMQIAMNSSNSSKYIKKIVFTAENDPSLAVTSVAKTSGTLTQTGAREWTWTNFAEDVTSVNFTSQGENDKNFLVSNINVYTTEAPTFEKVSPTPAFNRNSDSFNTGASVNISDLAINTTPVNFFFDYTFNAGNTGLTHTPYTKNTTWPGTITGTAAEGTATISASFDGSSNPFYNSVASTNVYTLTVTQASQDASWTYSADEKEIDGENRPYQGTVTFTSSGVIANGTKITDIPGLEVAFTAAGTVSNISTGNQNKYNGLALDGNGNVTFTPSVNGYLSIQGNFDINTSLGSISITKDYPTLTELTTPLIAGTTYTLSATGSNFNLAAFTFRPAFLTPDETAEQTEEFAAYSNTTEYPILVHSADAGVRFSGDRSVVNLSNKGDVTLVGEGTAVVRGKVIAGENELTASYTLKANVLSVASMTPTDGSTITTLDNSSVYIRFSYDIDPTVDAEKVVVLKDAQQLTGINVAKAGSSVSLHEKTLVLSNFGDMEAGSTYTIRLMSGCVSKEGALNVKNPEFIGTFTVESSEPTLTWVYPSTTSAVRIGTSIVLQTRDKINESYPDGGVKGTLTYDGDADDSDGYPMNLTAIKDGKNLVFKPTKPMVSNKLYTLTVGKDQVKLDGSNSMITKDKVFMFTTGTATGSAPVLLTSKSTPANEAVIDLPASTDKINLYFDQNLELEPYSTVSIIPVNGSESLSRGTSEKLDNNGVLVAQNMTIDSEDPTHLSFAVGSDLKYDLYYEMIIPANIVTAPGGMPNSAYTVKFKINRNPNSTEVTPATFYPHTWDFNKFGDSDNTLSSISIIKNHTNSEIDSRNNADQPIYNAKNAFIYSSIDGGKDYLCNAKSGYGFDQGNDIYIATSTTETYKLPEFEGIRVSTKNQNMSKRFAIRWLEGEKNKDGSDKYLFRMNGNTHYMTLSNVPVGKLYMVVNSSYLGINSPNATFESVSGEGYTLENNNTLLNTNGTKKVVINVTEAGDISFVVKNFTCEKIAVAAHTKTFKTNYAKDGKTYATDCLGYDVRYDLLNAFTDHSVKAYYITDMANSTGNTATVTATEVNQVNAVMRSQGVLVVYQGEVKNNTEVPVFKTDVNTSAKEVVASGPSEKLVNLFKTRNEITTKPANHYLYVLSYTGSQGGDLGFYNYVGSAYIDRAAYLFMPKEWVGEDPYGSGTTSARKASLITIDAEGVTTGVSEVETEKTPNNDGYFYNLNGMRVEHPKAGIYIRNGKKVVMK